MIGIGVSPGIAIGKVIIKEEDNLQIDKYAIDNVHIELGKLETAKIKSLEQIDRIYNRTLENMGQEEAQIFEAHKMMLNDPEYIEQIQEMIKNENVNVEWAVKQVSDTFISIFENMDDQYMKERAADIGDISKRLLKVLLGIEITDFSSLDEEIIIIAEDLTPSDTAQLDKNKVLGFITEIGGRTSHSAIMARTLELPAIVGVPGIRKALKNGDFLIFDGDTGEILINPDERTIEEYKTRKRDYEEFKNNLNDLIGSKTISKDGHTVELAANIGSPKDVDGVIKNDGEGVGLYRTEFLYMDKDRLPTEDEQFEAYKEVAQRLNPHPIIIRTLDIGGDKDLPYLKLPEEMNPFLGYRAIRISLDRKDIFVTQLRALLRASAYGNIKLMFPMISTIEELRDAKKILEDVKDELRNEEIEFKENLEVGIMVEIPSVAIMADIFAKEVDFFSIGTNDLIQYTVAVDRGNRKIAHLYNQFNPAVLRLIKNVIDKGHKEGIWVGMCGEVAGDQILIPLLLGMGLDEFSMSAGSILPARWIIKNTSKEDMGKVVDEILSLATAKEVKSALISLQNQE